MKSTLFILFFYWSLTFTLTAQSNSDNKYTALINANVITMTSEEVLQDYTVLIKNKMIEKIGKTKNIEIPGKAVIIDMNGKYLMPGLADMHTHINEPSIEESYLNLFIANGVTTIRDLAQGSAASILKLSEEIEVGKRLGPYILAANTIWGWENDPSKSIHPSKVNGYDCVKLNSYFSVTDFKETMNEAESNEIYTVGHLPFAVSFEDILDSGFDESSHILELAWFLVDRDDQFPEDPKEAENIIMSSLFSELEKYSNSSLEEIENIYSPKIKSIVDKIGKKDFTLTTTLAADHDVMMKLVDIDEIKYSAYSEFISEKFWSDIKSGKDKHLNIYDNPRMAVIVFKITKMFLKELVNQNKFLVLGSDVGPTYLSIVPGYSVHNELMLLVKNGLTPYEALCTATKNAAVITEKMIGTNEFGTLEAGKRADIIFLDKNPLDDIENISSIKGLFIKGNYLEKLKLDSLKTIQKKNLTGILTKQYQSGGIEEAISLYHQLKEDNFYNQYFYDEYTLNNLGYKLMNNGLTDDARKVFQLNIEEFPSSPNVYDSQGEFYLNTGDYQLALDYYNKSLEKDPNFESAIKMIRKINKQKK